MDKVIIMRPMDIVNMTYSIDGVIPWKLTYWKRNLVLINGYTQDRQWVLANKRMNTLVN